MKRILLFCITCLAAMAMYAAELNIYASGLKVNGVNSVAKTVSISYVLNAPATALEFQLINPSTAEMIKTIDITADGNITKGAHTTTVALGDVAIGNYRWALKATGTTVETYAKVFEDKDNFGFWGARGVAVDNSFESDHFGNIYVTNFNSGGGAGDVITRLTQTGVYALNALLTPINSNAYSGGLTWGTNSGIQWAIARPCVGPDGTVYISVGSATNSGVWMMDPANPTANFTPVFGGTHTSTGTTKNGDIVIHNSILHCYVEGVGAARKLYTYDLTTAATGGDILRYDIGELASPWISAPSATIYDDAANGGKINGGDCSIAPDGNGGWWICQYRAGSGKEADPCLIHTTNGTIDYNSGSTIVTTYQGGLAVSVDGKTLAIGTTRSTIKVFNVSYDETTNAPTLTDKTTISWTGDNNRNAKGLAFDVANNLYVVDNNREVGAVFAINGNTDFTTPAPSSQIFEITDNIVHVTGISLDHTNETLIVGETLTIIPTITPSDASNKAVIWSSDATGVATVNDNGVVTAVNVGDAIITAMSADDNTITATCSIHVDKRPVTGVSLNKSNITLSLDRYPNFTLVATVAPANASFKTVTWVSDNTSVATVSDAGKVTAVAAGTATITVTSTDNSEAKAVCEVVVRAASEPNIYAYGLSAGNEDASHNVEITYSLNAAAEAVTIEVLKGDDVKLTESLSDPDDMTKGDHTYTLDISTLPNGDYTWRVVAEAVAPTEMELLTGNENKYVLYAPRGLDVNKYPETATFGNVYVNMPYPGQGEARYAGSQTVGFFVYDAGLNLKNTENKGISPEGLAFTTGTQPQAAPYRVRVAEDGNVFVSGCLDASHGVWMVDGKLEGSFQNVLSNAGLVYGFDVTGPADNRNIYTMEDIVYQSSGSLKKYEGISALPSALDGEQVIDIKDIVAQKFTSLATDGKGGFWMCAYRGDDATGLSIVSHITASGTKNWNSKAGGLGISYNTQGAMALNADKTLLAVVSGVGGARKLVVFSIAWNGDDPSLTKVAESSVVSNTINDVAFDYADNLYSISAGTELIQVWALPKAENKKTTPASSAEKISISNSEVTTGIEDMTPVQYQKGVWTVTGQYLGENADNLPAGMYIIDGKKVIK